MLRPDIANGMTEGTPFGVQTAEPTGVTSCDRHCRMPHARSDRRGAGEARTTAFHEAWRRWPGETVHG